MSMNEHTFKELLGSMLVSACAFFIAANAHFAPAAEPQDLAAALKLLDARVFPADERERWQRILPDYLNRQIQMANERSTAEWKAIHNRADWERFQAAKLKALAASLNLPSKHDPAIVSHVTKSIQGDGFVIDNVLYESRPGWWVTANLYHPAKSREKMPVILLSHSHHAPKTEGELQDMGTTWARAGCYVLVPDHLGHGERRQHPFATAADFPRSFAVGRQDYYFRYDESLQLYAVGETLMGWMVWDLMRGVDFLLQQPSIDADKITLLGSVAGGGDPAAVTATLDERIACAVPFNFGGPQPETKYPLPADAETTFNYAGGGSWESTRNLYRSAADGFLPWVIVGGIAPRRLIYGHEFSWDQEHDPVWKRLQTVYGWYGAEANLAFTHGFGTLKLQPPDASHCNNIGWPHRKLIHEALSKWFDIDVTPAMEYSKRLPASELACWTDDWKTRLKPKSLRELAAENYEALADRRAKRTELWLKTLLLEVVMDRQDASEPALMRSHSEESAIKGIVVERVALRREPGIVVPFLVLRPAGKDRPPLVIGFAVEGKQRFLTERAEAIAELLSAGIAVCLVDVRGTGETATSDKSRDRTSTATDLAATQLMLGGDLLSSRAVDALAVIRHLQAKKAFSALALWGDSFASVNPPDRQLTVPHNIDGQPSQAEPLGGQLALLCGAVLRDEIKAVYIHRAVAATDTLFAFPRAYLPLDSILANTTESSRMIDWIESLAPRPLCLENPVDAADRQLSAKDVPAKLAAISRAYQKTDVAQNLILRTDRSAAASAAPWLIERLRGK